jgi:hypothetical protein
MRNTVFVLCAIALLIATTECAVAQPTIAAAPKVSQGNTNDPRIRLATFREFLIFDTNIESADRDRTQLNLILDSFDREFSDERNQKGNRIDVPSGFRLIPNGGDDRLVWEIVGDTFTPDDIRDKVKAMGEHVRAGDIVFAYILCHGGKDSDGSEYLLAPRKDQNGSERISRDWLRNQLEFNNNGTRTWLTVFITDACSVIPAPPLPSQSPVGPKIWKSLYFAHRGTVDIPTSEAGKPSFSVGGSLFLEAFRNTFAFQRQDIDGGKARGDRLGDKLVEWNELEYFGLLRDELNKEVSRIDSQYFDDKGNPTSAHKQLGKDKAGFFDDFHGKKQNLRRLDDEKKTFRKNFANEQ